LKHSADLPDPASFLEIANSKEGSKWLLLEGSMKWRHKEHIGTLGTTEPESREVWYAFRPYITTAYDFRRLWAWANGRRWFESDMPEARAKLRICLHEHFWPPCFDSPLDEEWQTELFGNPCELPCPILPAYDEYMCERGTRDCSVDETVIITLPCRWLVEKMDLQMRGRRGEFFDSTGQLVAFDPSTREAGPGALLMRKESLLRFLRQSGHRIFWTFLGAKDFNQSAMSARFETWLGKLEINGAYTLEGDEISGSFSTSFKQGGLTEDGASDE
jgi:hypothetical protein